jgi:hypothetical protein
MKPASHAHVYDASKRKASAARSAACCRPSSPSFFGPTVTQRFADKIDALFERFHPPRSRLKAGQVFWLGRRC